MVGEEKRHQMMQNLFGDQSEEEEEVESEHESNRQPDYVSDEGDGGLEPEGEGEVEGPGEAEVESEGELHEVGPDPGDSEGERDQSSQEVEVDDQREESDGKESESDDKEEYGQRDEEVDQARSSSRSTGEEKDDINVLHSAPEIRDVFGDSDDEEPAEYAVQNHIEEDSIRSPLEDEGSYGKDLRPEDILPDEDAQYQSEEEDIEGRPKEKPVGPPLELEIPLRPPPAHPDKVLSPFLICVQLFFNLEFIIVVDL
ncbi:hypothetical protein F0562_023690 [Nyssa sinensis]|uniref:Uncharacterized protein n=1 Tax=Nyssa sinensis TaxID=561372 RepID=A0A5J5BIS8_9ASTE|nr:hypothetical protein F0562_023690 [Nyssa sinensis]